MCSVQETHVQCPPNSAIQLVERQHANRVATGCSNTPPRTTENSRCGHVHTNRTARRGVHPSPTSLDNNSKKKETEPKPNVRAVQARNTKHVPLPHQRCASACAISCTNARWEICATAWSDHVGPASPGNTCIAVHACNITAVKSRSHWKGSTPF